MNKYRSHNCGELRKKNVGNDVFLAGWINKKRDHGNLLFIDLRDNYGISQCVIEKGHNNFWIRKGKFSNKIIAQGVKVMWGINLKAS